MGMRGFVSGVIWGGVVVTLGLGVASQLVPLPERAVLPEAANTATPVAEADPAPVAEPAPEALAPAAESGTNVAATAQLPTEQVPAQDSDGLAPQVIAPEAPVAETTATETPSTETPSTEPASLAPAEPAVTAPTPPAVSAESPAAPVPADQAADLADAAPGAASETDDTLALQQPSLPKAAAPDTSPASAELPPVPPLTPEEEALLIPTPEVAEEGGALATTPGPVLDPEPEPEPAPLDLAEPEPLLDAPALPSPGFADAVDGVTTGRLPSISDTPGPAETANETVPLIDNADQPPVIRYAATFDNAAAKPLFAVILQDTGAADLDRATLAALPFPVTFAIDPATPDAAAHAALYRAAGKEVVMIASGIPVGATASDLEVTFQSHARTLPEAVAVLDLETDGFQNNRPLATQVVPVIDGQGRGVVTWDKGLNAGDQVAQREGVPAARIFRRLDSEGEASAVIRRYLDRAAFKAAQDGRVTVLGDTRPETIAALLEWSVEGRAASVALAPLTAVLSRP